MTPPTVTRRIFVRRALASSALLLACRWQVKGESAESRREWQANAFLRIDRDDTITVISKHTEMGQGAFTTVAMALVEELDAPWSAVRVIAAPTGPSYVHGETKIQMTGGSSTTRECFTAMREAGATARALLMAAAAECWQMRPDELHTAVGRVLAPDGRSLRYGELVERAARLPIPSAVPLKPRGEWRLLGRGAARIDAHEKITGAARYGIDVSLPGLKTALLLLPPHFGARLQTFDATAAKAEPGVHAVVPVSAGVAVVADNFLAAQRGRDALAVTWSPGSLAELSESTQSLDFRAALDGKGRVALDQGDFAAAWARAAERVEAEIELPYLAHACLEPINATAWVKRAGTVEIWAPTHFPGPDREAAARIAGVPVEKVSLQPMLMGGSFGRKAAARADFVGTSVEIARQCDVPVKVIWTREDDLRAGYYRPRVLARSRIALSSRGEMLGWRIDTVGQRMSTMDAHDIPADAPIEGSMVEGFVDLPYHVPNRQVVWHEIKAGAPVQWWRSVGHSQNAFIKEVAIDDAARRAGADPIEFRLRYLAAHPRQVAVLRKLQELTPAAVAGRYHGVALHESFGTIVGEIVELEVEPAGSPKVLRVICVVDCGWVVNPPGARAQVMSGVIFGLSAALFGRITLERGAAAQSNFHDYRVLRLPEAPRVETHFIESDGPLGGLGEPSLPPVAPALVNAWFRATGQRVWKLPLLASNAAATG